MNIQQILDEIEKAYPEDIFPPTTEAERQQVIEQYPGFIDRTSAMMGRHLAKVIREKLSKADEEFLEWWGLNRLAFFHDDNMGVREIAAKAWEAGQVTADRGAGDRS